MSHRRGRTCSQTWCVCQHVSVCVRHASEVRRIDAFRLQCVPSGPSGHRQCVSGATCTHTSHPAHVLVRLCCLITCRSLGGTTTRAWASPTKGAPLHPRGAAPRWTTPSGSAGTRWARAGPPCLPRPCWSTPHCRSYGASRVRRPHACALMLRRTGLEKWGTREGPLQRTRCLFESNSTARVLDRTSSVLERLLSPSLSP